MRAAVAAVFVGFSSITSVEAGPSREICLLLADADSGKQLIREGDCETRVTPASTFKVALAVMGYDAGILLDEQSPVLPFREGYPDWGGAEWRKATNPARWMRYSILWYSRLITRELGVAQLERYARDFQYGNADFAGDPGKNNALDRAWISSSLRISPREQVSFLRRLLNRQLPVGATVYDQVERVVETRTIGGGWAVSGKTGSAYPYKSDGTFDRKNAWGWFVGWARKGSTTLVFAKLEQVDSTAVGSGGLYVRRQFLDGWTKLIRNTEH